MWQGLQTIPDYKKKTSLVTDTDVLLPDKLNNFFARFENNLVCKNAVRMLFIDYSSAFNTIVPSKLIIKLETLCLDPPSATGSWTSGWADPRW